MTKADLEQIKILMTQFAETVNTKIEGLKELVTEKLNGHGDTVGRLQKEVDHLYQLDRDRVSDIGGLVARVSSLETALKGQAALSATEEKLRDKKEEAVDSVKSGYSATRVAILCTVVGAVATIAAVFLTVWLTGGHPA